MSDIVSRDEKHAVYAGVAVDVAEASLDRVQLLLAGIPGGVYKAVGSALARAAQAGRTEAKGAVTKEYAISSGTFISYTNPINHFQRSGKAGGLSVVFGFSGHVIPLLKFNTSVSGKNGTVATQVIRSHGKQALDKAFRATVNGHTGIFEREGKERLPIRELFGPATTQMMYSNEEVLDAVEEKMAAVYEQRIEHEILRILNGWGDKR